MVFMRGEFKRIGIVGKKVVEKDRMLREYCFMLNNDDLLLKIEIVFFLCIIVLGCKLLYFEDCKV